MPPWIRKINSIRIFCGKKVIAEGLLFLADPQIILHPTHTAIREQFLEGKDHTLEFTIITNENQLRHSVDYRSSGIKINYQNSHKVMKILIIHIYFHVLMKLSLIYN